MVNDRCLAKSTTSIPSRCVRHTPKHTYASHSALNVQSLPKVHHPKCVLQELAHAYTYIYFLINYFLFLQR